MAVKRDLLERAARDDPEPENFEAWLLAQCFAVGPGGAVGAPRAMALEIAAEWRLAVESPSFRAWLAKGAPSDDARPDD